MSRFVASLLLVLVFAAGLSGCSSEPDMETPATPDPPGLPDERAR